MIRKKKFNKKKVRFKDKPVTIILQDEEYAQKFINKLVLASCVPIAQCTNEAGAHNSLSTMKECAPVKVDPFCQSTKSVKLPQYQSAEE